MLLKDIRNHFWFAAAENKNVLGLNLWKKLKSYSTKSPTNTFFLAAPENKSSSLDMYQELLQAVEKGNIERVDYIFNNHIDAFTSFKSPGEEECANGSGTEMVFTPYSIIDLLKRIAESNKQTEILPVLEAKSTKVSAYLVQKYS